MPAPEPGLVIRYSYLWRDEARRGQQEGSKDRPCAVVLALLQGESGTLVMVAPITHSPPDAATSAIEIPWKVSEHLGLDDDRSWIIASEVNTFTWPGPDIRPVDTSVPERAFSYGHLPRALSLQVRDLVSLELRKRRLGLTNRDA